MDAKRKQMVSEYKTKTKKAGVAEIKNEVTDRRLVLVEKNLAGCENRFQFSKATGSCVYHQLAEDWKRYGAAAFSFRVVAEVSRKDDETEKEFLKRLSDGFEAALAAVPEDRRY